MQTQRRRNQTSLLRIVAAIVTLIPPVVLSVLLLIASPDLETWLTHQTGEFFRKDAFESVNEASPVFAVTLAFTSFFAMYLVLAHRSAFLLPLAAGPLLAAIVYLATYGITDPAWFTLFALMSIGMLVATPVTFMWTLWSKHQPETACTECGLSPPP